MKIAVLGTGMVGQEIASKLVSKGHEVMMGSRTSDNGKANDWVQKSPSLSSQGTFKNAVDYSEGIVFNCTKGQFVFDVLDSIGTESLSGKILVDISNPLDFSNGMPPSLSIVNTDSQGEKIQRDYPDTHVVKTLNTLNNEIMLNPKKISGSHNIFMSGNEETAKTKVKNLLNDFGWSNDQILDIGDITSARATEMLLPIWLRLYGKFGHGYFNFSITKDK